MFKNPTGIWNIDYQYIIYNEEVIEKSIERGRERNEYGVVNVQNTHLYLLNDIRSYNASGELFTKMYKEVGLGIFMGCIYSNQEIISVYIPFKKIERS
jgi:hypothetical protein